MIRKPEISCLQVKYNLFLAIYFQLVQMKAMAKECCGKFLEKDNLTVGLEEECVHCRPSLEH